MIRVAFRYGDPRIFARLVTLLQGGDSAHCEVAYAWQDTYHECVSSSFLDGGIRKKVIDMPATKWRIYELDSVDVAKVEEVYKKYEGSKYDWLGLAGFVFRRVKGFLKRVFCSEYAAEVVGLDEPHRFDLILLESVCKLIGRRVQ